MIDLKIDGPIATLEINRPEKLNALTIEMLKSISQYLDHLENLPAVRVLLLTGAGEKSFCVGADIHEWSGLDAVGMWKHWIREGHKVYEHLARLNLPTIAVLNGYTFGGGLELALACDIRIAAAGIKMGLPEVKLGIIPGWGGTNRLPALIGTARAKQIMFTGMQLDTEKTEAWGLINEAVPPEQLMDRAHDMANQIAGNAPLAVQMVKQVIDGGISNASGYYLEALASGLARFTDDAHEGIAAFKEKRPAKFLGK